MDCSDYLIGHCNRQGNKWAVLSLLCWTRAAWLPWARVVTDSSLANAVYCWCLYLQNVKRSGILINLPVFFPPCDASGISMQVLQCQEKSSTYGGQHQLSERAESENKWRHQRCCICWHFLPFSWQFWHVMVGALMCLPLYNVQYILHIVITLLCLSNSQQLSLKTFTLSPLIYKLSLQGRDGQGGEMLFCFAAQPFGRLKLLKLCDFTSVALMYDYY